MKCNVATWDRVLRGLIGLTLTAWAIAGGPAWAYLGLYFIITAAWGLCPLYASLKTGTLSS